MEADQRRRRPLIKRIWLTYKRYYSYLYYIISNIDYRLNAMVGTSASWVFFMLGCTFWLSPYIDERLVVLPWLLIGFITDIFLFRKRSWEPYAREYDGLSDKDRKKVNLRLKIICIGIFLFSLSSVIFVKYFTPQI